MCVVSRVTDQTEHSKARGSKKLGAGAREAVGVANGKNPSMTTVLPIIASRSNEGHCDEKNANTTQLSWRRDVPELAKASPAICAKTQSDPPNGPGQGGHHVAQNMQNVGTRVGLPKSGLRAFSGPERSSVRRITKTSAKERKVNMNV